jgi:hypothetical protein
MKQVYDQAKSPNPVNSTKGREEMFNKMVLCCGGGGLAISLTACGQSGKSVEAKCEEMIKAVPGYDKGGKTYLGDEAYAAYIKQCLGTMKAQ